MTTSALVLIAVWLLPQARPADAQRELPSKHVACPRDQLTNYSGVVIAYRREAGRTLLTIRTDWDTTERVELKHPGTDDPSQWFLLRGRPFTPDDWKAIETERGQLQPKTRATAWVCDDGSNAVVDWNRPSEGR